MGKPYGRDFYENRHRKSLPAAEKILGIVADALPPVRSAVDFGCGVGTWLSVLKNRGTDDILGLDGAWVEREFLQIPQACFREADFEKRINLDKRYDLAISLEVAEHLSPDVAGDFVKSLTQASDFVLFSAAIPFQEGTHHINLQWQAYWAGLFGEQGFRPFDLVRKPIWMDNDIAVFYRQNILVYVKEDRVGQLEVSGSGATDEYPYLSLVHPETYLEKAEQMYTVKGSFKLFRKAVKRHLRSLLSTS